MTRKYYNCTLLTDIVLSSSPATQGFYESLDYIPGSKFLGIVAGKLYNDQATTAKAKLDLFHNGTVCFGDAHPYILEQRTLKVPLSWHRSKTKPEASAIFLYHNLSDTDKAKLAGEGIQLKQERGKYIATQEGSAQQICTYSGLQRFSIKSAYDKIDRRSKNGNMYGYFGMSKGSTWCFYIDYGKKEYISMVEAVLLSKQDQENVHYIGRSKAAEYGMVKVEALASELTPVTSFESSNDRQYLYAASNLCFYDDFGRCTTAPTLAQLKLPKHAKIDWVASQIRTRPYRTWNQKRSSRDADRQLIEKGSVIVIELKNGVAIEQIKTDLASGIGSHKSEGFGQILINPSFLQPIVGTPIVEGMKLSAGATSPYLANAYKAELPKRSFIVQQDAETDDVLKNFLNRSRAQYKELLDIDELVNKFVQENRSIFKAVSASQWGIIRRYAKFAADAEALERLLFADKGLLARGQTEKIWRKKNRRSILYNKLYKSNLKKHNILEFTQKLAAEMAKY